jgi:hypothetical protein
VGENPCSTKSDTRDDPSNFSIKGRTENSDAFDFLNRRMMMVVKTELKN